MSEFGSALKRVAPKVVEKLAVPQRIAMRKLAETMGLPGAMDSEQNAQAIVEKVAEQAGIPEDSTAGNVAKGISVAALEVFGDPLQALPLGKISKAVKAGTKILNNAHRAEKILELAPKVEKTVTRGGAFLGGELLKEANTLSKDAKIVQKVVSGPASQVGQRFRAEKIASDAVRASKAVKKELP